MEAWRKAEQDILSFQYVVKFIEYENNDCVSCIINKKNKKKNKKKPKYVRKSI